MKKVQNCFLACLIIIYPFIPSYTSSLCETNIFVSAWKMDTPIIIHSHDTDVSTYSLEIPPFEIKKDMILVMKFKARLHTDTPAGWNEYLGIEVNGQELDKRTSFSEQASGYNRLINRGSPLKTTLGEKAWWSIRNDVPVLLVYFGDGNTLDERILNYQEEGYWYLLNISDVAHYIEVGADERIEKAEKNQINFINTYINKNVPDKNIDMVIENLEIGYLPKEFVEKYSKPEMMAYTNINTKESISVKNYTVNIGQDGETEIKTAEGKYKLVSTYSYPSEKIGFSYFDSTHENPPDWKIDIHKITDNSVSIEASGKDYLIMRKIEVQNEKISIKETITNKNDEPIGIIIAHQIILEDMPVRYRIAGIEDTERLAGVAENPTIFMAYRNTSLGFLAEDNLLRAQGEITKKSNMFQYSTKHFGLDKGKSYTFQFSLYPSQGGDYFTFINQVRNEWHVNYTIEGPFAFSDQIIPGRKIKIYTVGPWLDYYSLNPETGKVYTREDYKKQIKSIIERIKQSQPDALILGLTETNLYTIDKRDIKGGEILPGGSNPRSGKYGYILDKKQSEVLKTGINGWVDSILQTEDGRVIVDTYYPDSPNTLNLMLYLEKENYRYKFFKNQIDFLMDEVGLDGVYIDQFTLNWGPIGRADRHTYEKWDGYTVDIDEVTGKITRKYTDCGVIGAEARKDILNYIVSKGGISVINSFPSANEEQNIPNVFRFAEFENDPVNPLTYMDKKPPLTVYCAKGHLSTPIILGIRPQRFDEEGKKKCAEIIMKSVITALRNGLLYYYYSDIIPSEGEGSGEYGPINHMFPFTPVEINEGYIIGKERIITTVSKTFNWHKEPVICLFDLKGKQIAHHIKVTKKETFYLIEIVLNDWNQIAIVE
ncbi:MAG: hypothetical protein LDL53_07265 [Candidatus Hydrogenedens sp.]|nr:hypothetical protein [Candidatus Hydrogenedens sp.]